MDQLNKALDCSTSVFIQACAGAGKTFALTKRYAAILDSFAEKIEKGADPKDFDQRQILVITFTKKATGEMNRRIYNDVNILLSGKKPEGMKDYDFCPTLRRSQHENVRFFTRNLKETFSRNSISTIDSFCANILREFAYKLDLDPQFLSQDEHDTKKLLNETLDAWVADRLKDDPAYFESLLDDLSFYEIKEIMKSMYGSREVLDDYIRNFEMKPDDEIWHDWLINYLADADVEMLSLRFDSIWAYAQENCKERSDALFMMLQHLNNEIQKLDRSGDPLEYRAAFLSVLRSSSLFTSKNEYRASVPGRKGNWKEGKDFAEDWFDLLKMTEAKEILMSPGPQDYYIIPLLKSLIEHYRNFDDYFNKIRMDRDLLDFSDVIILTHKLLEDHEDVRQILGKRYRHIMLDEFQDTNPKRWQIIDMILRAGNDIKLFIVGDRKQSIYRFNNADVTVMDTAQDIVKSLGGEAVDFNDNYRSSQQFIDEAINPLMGSILKKPNETKEKYEAVFEETKSPIDKQGLKEKTIERIWCEYGSEDEDYIPAYHTAYQVRRLLKEYENSKIDDNPHEPLIGVLLRRGTKIGEYLQAFHQFDIPVTIVGGKDFYASQALKDVFHLISVLDNPMDDHALIGLLRSPFIALPDPLIHKLAERGKRSIFEAMSSIPELQSAYHDLLIWKERSKTVPLDELIAGIIDSDDRELGYVSELMPEQQLANLDKALNMIRGLQKSGSSLREIREFLYYQIKTKADESQADYPAKAKVQILTVHKAKGLEFPIVVIPEMNSRGNSGKNKFRYGKHGERPEITLSLGDDEKPGMLTRLKEITKNEEEAEDKRIFYVAVTRAIHKVLLLGEGEKDKKALTNGWWMKYAMGIENAEDTDREVQHWGGDVEVIQKKQIMPLKAPKVHDTRQWKEKDRVEEPGKYLYRSPHDLMGMDEGNDFEFAQTGLGTAPGNIFHYCMERGWLDIDQYEPEIKKHISEHYADLPRNELLAKLKPWLANINNHELGNILLDRTIEKHPEHKIKGWLGNGRDIVQVSGSIDLLYRQDGQWVILDYKTDSTKRLLPFYTLQLQSYQWILKQVYGIEALAKIYFVSLNECETIKWNDHYFDEISLDLEVRPELPSGNADLSKIIPEIKSGKQLILCASAQHEEQVYLALAIQGLLRPNIKVSTLNKFLNEGNNNPISQDKLRLMIRYLNPGMKNGTADHLAKALRDEELKKGQIKREFKDKYKDVLSLPSYHSAAEPYFNATADGTRIILLDVYAESEIEKMLIERLSRETELVSLSLSQDQSNEKHTLINAFSPREEVLACAAHIKKNCTPDEEVMIAVASMEKYAPHLHRQLPKLGLRARFIGPRSLYEFPCTNLLMTYVKLCSKNDPDWNELAFINLHALMDPEDRLFAHDKKVRQNPVDEKTVPQTDLYFCKKPSELLDHVKKFADILKKDKQRDTCKACDKFLEILNKVIGDMTAIEPKTDMGAIYRELSERVKKESIPRRDQWNGIPVVGLLDSLGVQVDKLYVLGMVEGDIPRQESDNPFFSKNRDHTLELNKHFMKEWNKLGKKVVFCTSAFAEDGSEQNRSSFLEDLTLDVIDEAVVSRREELLSYKNYKISGENSILIERHHDIVEEKRGNFSGCIDDEQGQFNIPVTQVDKLLACPMKFYIESIMRSYPMDQEETLYWGGVRGNVIHKAFEFFIEKNGYDLELKDAIKLMKKCLDKAFEFYEIEIDDPLIADRFRQYIKNLEPGSEKNCLALNLGSIKDRFGDFNKLQSEVDFKEFILEHPDLEILLNGRIDKIMINEEEQKLIASDFKTGSVKTALLSKMMLSQLYLYLKYCAEAYPEYELKAMYELLKNPKETKMVEYTLNDTEFRQGRQSFMIEDFEQHLRQLFSQIAEGKYYITEKDYSDACLHCPHTGLCRRDTRLKTKEH